MVKKLNMAVLHLFINSCVLLNSNVLLNDSVFPIILVYHIVYSHGAS